MRNRRRLIRYIILILIIALGIGSFTLAYTTTDFLKTDKQLFYKYLSQVVENLENLENEQVTNYLNKIEETPYETKGKITAYVEVPGIEEYINKERVNNLNVTFEGKEDKQNKKSAYNINLNYAEDVSFPIEYRKSNDLYAIRARLIVNSYIGIKNQELQSQLAKMGMAQEDIIKILDIISGLENKIKIEDIRNGLEGINENIIGNNFSKNEEDTVSLSLTKKEAEETIKKILEKIKIISQEDRTTIINLIQNSEAQDEESEFLKITITKNGKINIITKDESSKIEIETTKTSAIFKIDSKGKNLVFSIGKVESQDKIEYTLTLRTKSTDQREIEIYLTVAFSDIENQNPKENYSFGLYTNEEDDEIQYRYGIEEERNFANNITIDNIEDKNITILNDLNEEDTDRLLKALKLKIEAINRIQMQQLGLDENQNPLIYATPTKYIDMMINPIAEDINAINERKEKEDEQIQIRAFNARFENYQGAKPASTVKTLISSVISNNLSNNGRLVSVNGMTNQTELTNYMNSLNNSNTYIVTIGISEKGYINTIQIN